MPNEYDDFEIVLENSHQWPAVYPFKFIFDSDSLHLHEILSAFEVYEHEVTSRNSTNNRYISLTIKAHMKSPKQVIQIYQKINKLNGVIVL